MSEIVSREVDGKLLKALVVVFDTPGRNRRIHKALNDFPARYPMGSAEFLAAVSEPVDLLLISTHGYLNRDAISGGGSDLEIAHIQAAARTVVVSACYQNEHRFRLWKSASGAASILHASDEPPWETSARAIRRVLERPESWAEGAAVAAAFLDAPRATSVFHDAGWSLNGKQVRR